MSGKETRNSKTLASFSLYCVRHPNERFWQALRNWSGMRFILAASEPPSGDLTYNTFSWEGKGPGTRTDKGNHAMGSKDELGNEVKDLAGVENAADIARGMGIEWGMEAARLQRDIDEIETVDALLNKEAAAYSIETNIRALATLGDAAPQSETLNALRELCRMSLQQFQFQLGKRQRGWDLALLMEQLASAVSGDNDDAQRGSGVLT